MRTIAGLLLLLPALCWGDSLFNGTWRPEPQRPDPKTKPDAIEVLNGQYTCHSCTPPYTIPADQHDHAVSGSPYYDTLNVQVVDARNIFKTAKKKGQVVAEIKESISADGATRTGIQTVAGMMPQPVELTTTYSRVSQGPKGSHALSGQWREIQTDLTHHDEDTTYTVNADTLSMTDRMGRSFSAKLDGTDAPYKGDPQYTSVSVRMIDERTLEESDKKDGKVVQINRWSIDPDGITIHARFDDTQGHIENQTGHKLP